MARQRKAPEAGNSALDVPSWMLTFSDCMTLLLTFFVLLLSFSSFDESTLRQLEGAFSNKPSFSIRDDPQKIDDSMIKQETNPIDRTDDGAEIRTEMELNEVINPQKPDPIMDIDAYDQKRTFSIPAGQLFLGQGVALTAEGQAHLSQIARFVHAVPCKIVIGELAPSSDLLRKAGGSDQGLLRSWVIMQFLTQQQGVDPNRFCLAATQPLPEDYFQDQALLQVSLLAMDFTR